MPILSPLRVPLRSANILAAQDEAERAILLQYYGETPLLKTPSQTHPSDMYTNCPFASVQEIDKSLHNISQTTQPIVSCCYFGFQLALAPGTKSTLSWNVADAAGRL